MRNLAGVTEDAWRLDDTTVTESTTATFDRVQQAEANAAAFESDVPTRKSAVPGVLAKAAEEAREEQVDDIDVIEVIIDDDDRDPA